MKTRNSIFLITMISLVGCGNLATKNKTICTQDSCATDPACQCWCSVKCGYRDKNSTDHPTYIANDPNGKFCYCKQWDADNYKARCIEGKDIKEPAGAK